MDKKIFNILSYNVAINVINIVLLILSYLNKYLERYYSTLLLVSIFMFIICFSLIIILPFFSEEKTSGLRIIALSYLMLLQTPSILMLVLLWVAGSR